MIDIRNEDCFDTMKSMPPVDIRRRLWEIATGNNHRPNGEYTNLPRESADAIKKAYDFLGNLWENYMQNGKINPVSGIFLGKNNFGYNFVEWLKAAGIRAIKTVAQTAVATIGTSAVISEVNWTMVLSASLLAGVLSLLTSVAGLPELEKETWQEVE